MFYLCIDNIDNRVLLRVFLLEVIFIFLGGWGWGLFKEGNNF